MLESLATPELDRLRVPRLTGARIDALGITLPQWRQTSAELAEQLGVEEEWILSRTGIRARHRVRDGERLSDHAARAGAAALAEIGLPAEELDLVIVASLTQDELTPNAAPLVAHELGALRAGTFDVGAACSSFLSGLAVATAQIESGRAEHVLLIGADFITRITDYGDRRTAPLFADACGAVVLGAAAPFAPGRIGPIRLGADGSHGRTIVAEHSDRKVRMDGPEVFRHAVNRMGEAALAAAADAGLTLDDIDLFVPHQANARITRALGQRLGLEPGRVVDCIGELGNSSAATLPLALHHARDDGRLVAGAKVMLAAFGAGFTWGAGVIEWGGAGG